MHGIDPLKTSPQASNRAQERTDAHRAEIKLAAKSDVAAAKATNPQIHEVRLDEAITDLVIETTPEELNADLVQGGLKKKNSKTQAGKIIADAAERTDEEGNLPACAIRDEQADLIGSIDSLAQVAMVRSASERTLCSSLERSCSTRRV